MVETREPVPVKTTRIAGRVIGLLMTLFLLMFYVSDIVVSLQEGQPVDFTSIIAASPVIVALVGCVLSWWWVLPAGMVLILAYLLTGTTRTAIAFFSGEGLHWSTFWWVIGLAYLVGGILLIVSSMLYRRAKSSAVRI